MRLNLGAIVATAAAMLSSLPLLASACNPRVQTCPANPALGKSANYNFAGGAGPDWKAGGRGEVTYGSDGASFTIAKKLDNPELSSKFYMMFGRLDVVMKAAPGKGVVSSVFLLSDSKDEIDFEWLGGDNTQVQTNYFRNGPEHGYGNGAFHANPGNQDAFKTYTIDWNKDRIIWQVDGATVRTVTSGEAGAQYPQTPAYIKVGIWAGGDSSNEPGTIEWAGGSINYADAPFTMQVKSIRATDYSSGSEYQYSDNSGSWQSIKAVGGQVNHQSSETENLSAGNFDAATSSSATTASSSAPSATKGASACPSGATTGAECSTHASGSVSQTSEPATSTASGELAPSQTGAASNIKSLGSQTLVLVTAIYGFGAAASLF